MENSTKTGLLIIIIGMILGIISNITLFFVNFNVDVSKIEDLYFAIAPSLIFTVIAGILILIGGILMIIGREDYGEKHSKFVLYAIIIFVVNFMITIILNGISSALEPTSYFMFVKPTLSDYEPIILITVISSTISAIFAGLTYVFLLYHLENEKGRIVLFTAYIVSVIIAIVVAIYNHGVFTEMMRDLLASDTIDSSTISQVTAQLSSMSKATIFSSIGAILFIFATYIPYKRIKSGELIPVLPSHLKRCMKCGRVNPSDSVICAYCGNRFSNYQYNTYNENRRV